MLRLAGVVALAAFVWAVARAPRLDLAGWALAAALTALLVAILRFPIVYTWRKAVMTSYADETVVMIAIALLSPTAAAAILCVGHAIEQVLARRIWIKSTTNMAITALGGLNAAAVATLVLAAFPWPLLAAAAGVAAYTVTSAVLLSIVLAAVEGGTIRGALMGGARLDMLHLPFGIGVGIVAIALWSLHPLAIALMVPVILVARRFSVLVRSVRREQETREAVARMTEALAGSFAPERAADGIAECCREVFTPGRVVVEIAGLRREQQEGNHTLGAPALEERLLAPDGTSRGLIRIEPSRRTPSGFSSADAALLRIIAAASSSAAQNVLAVREAREAQARLVGWLDHAHDAVTIIDDTGRVEYANPAAARLLGARPGLRAADVLPDATEPTGEARARGEHGETFVALGSTPLPSGGRLVIARDVSEERRRRESEAALVHAERLATIGSLTSGVGHEINNALTLIVTRLELARLTVRLARDSGKLEAGVATDLDESHAALRKAMDRIATIARSLRAAARKHGPEAVRLDAAVEEVLTLADVRLKPEIQVVKDFAATSPVHSDAGEVTQILLNLVLNAADAMRTQGGGTLRVQTREDAGYGVVTIADTGPGIPTDVQAHIFETFFTTKPNGTGLGLALSRRLAREHGGDLSFASEPGHGAVFSLRLPLAAAAKA